MQRSTFRMIRRAGPRWVAVAGAALVAVGLAGCAMPRHSNTLVFGTTTLVALDVTQEPTGAMGVTLGYKRHEAVWMPLIANQADADGKLVPSACQDDACRKLVGSVGTGAGAAGAGAIDTYSVLATFSGDMSGSGKTVEAKGSIAQYFATGFAARLLAQNGGAAAVSAGAKSPGEVTVSAEAAAIVTGKRSQVGTIAAKLSKTTGEVNADALAKLLTLSPASEIDAGTQTLLKGAKTRTALEAELVLAPESVVSRLFKSLDQL